jgi:uncharacterized protein (DUF952 family)
MNEIYHRCPAKAWAAAFAVPRYDGTVDDRRDAFIHFSAAEKLPEDARRHRAGQAGLVLVVKSARLGERPRREPWHGGALFSHLYGPRHPDEVVQVEVRPLGLAGEPVFPPPV